VRRTFAEFGLPTEANAVELVRGLYEDTLTGDEPVALAHVDCDWYDSVNTCLTRLAPRLVPGGVLVIDDYEHWSGCRRAVDDFFSDKRDSFEFVQKARLHVVRRG
jgi:asparagine synthase (glutamine-hydrolysing)